MRKALLLVALMVIGGFFSGCTATRGWVQDTLKESIDTVKTEVKADAKTAIDTVVANLMNALKDQGKKLLAEVTGVAKDATQTLLDVAEKKRKEALVREIAKINVELAKVVPDLSYDTNKDGQVTCEDFLDENGDLPLSASLRLVMYYRAQPAKPGQTKDNNALALAVGAMGLLGVGGAAGSYAQKKLKNNQAPPTAKA